MKAILRITGLIGILIFGMAFWFTFGVPGGVERIAKDFIKERVEIETGEQIDSLDMEIRESTLGKIAENLLGSKESEIESLKGKLKRKTYDHTAAVIAEMSELSCECRKRISERLKLGLEVKLTLQETVRSKIREFISMKYLQVVNQLTTDLRIFTGSNIAIFVFLLIVSFAKPQAISHLFLPGVLLFTTTLICSFFYLFEQNWILTIIYNDYLGFGYLGYLGVLFGVLCDIAFNKARITTELINSFFQFLGSAFSVVPC